MPVKIYHNPHCSKSRQTLALLNERGINPDIIEYLQTPPDADTLVNICAQLGIGVHELMRTGEDEYKAAQADLEGLDDAGLARWLAARLVGYRNSSLARWLAGWLAGSISKAF